MSTIDSLHCSITQKLTAVETAISILQENSKGDSSLDPIQDKFKQLRNEFELNTMDVMSKYCMNPNTPNIRAEYTKVVSSGNYMAMINEVSRDIKTIIGIIFPQYQQMINSMTPATASHTLTDIIKRDIEEIFRQLSISDSITITQSLNRSDYEICDCGEKMIVAPTSSELFCPNDDCGEIRILYGTVFEDYQFYNQDGQKTKHGSYTHMRHLKFWIERIQARENKEFTPSQHEKLDHCIKRDGMLTGAINCVVMRDYLKECKMTNLNNHAPLLVRLKTGRVPPQLAYNEVNELSIKFSKMMELYDRLNPEETFGRQNKPYYPFFIYKILESMFAGNREKIKILECIHLQSRETVVENDLIFEKICEASEGEFVFKPTDRSEHVSP